MSTLSIVKRLMYLREYKIESMEAFLGVTIDSISSSSLAKMVRFLGLFAVEIMRTNSTYDQLETRYKARLEVCSMILSRRFYRTQEIRLCTDCGSWLPRTGKDYFRYEL